MLTACIPSLKGIVDSLLGSTAVAAIQAPYELRDSGKGSHLEVTSTGDAASKQRSCRANGGQDPQRSRQLRLAELSGWSADRDVTAQYDGKMSLSRSDSVQKLTEGVIVVRDEFEIQYEDKRMSVSQDSSQGSLFAQPRTYE